MDSTNFALRSGVVASQTDVTHPDCKSFVGPVSIFLVGSRQMGGLLICWSCVGAGTTRGSVLEKRVVWKSLQIWHDKNPDFIGVQAALRDV